MWQITVKQYTQGSKTTGSQLVCKYTYFKFMIWDEDFVLRERPSVSLKNRITYFFSEGLIFMS
jgi:hypothetical protein